MKVHKICRTCEFNFDGICTGDGIYKYGEKIISDNIECSKWGISYEYFVEITEQLPWYIKRPFNRCKVSFDEVLELIEKENRGIGIDINIYDAIEEIYGVSLEQLSEILDVKCTVVIHAKYQGTVEKRKSKFSAILCIPEEFFESFTSNQLKDLERCKQKFYS